MKRVVLLVVFGAALLYGTAWAVSWAAWTRAGSRAWPMELGTLEQIPAQYPRRAASADALRLTALARPLGIDFGAYSGSKADQAIDADFIAEHAVTIDEIRDHLVRSRDLAWDVDLDKKIDAPLPNLKAHMQLARIFVARGTWDDLHAAAMLERSLRSRGELVSQMVALEIAKEIDSAAAKTTSPAPAWIAEFHATDRRRLFLRATQHDTWLFWSHGSRPYELASMANMASLQRETAFELAQITDSQFDAKAFSQRREQAIPRWNTLAHIAIPNLGAGWARVLEYERTTARPVERHARAQ